MGVGGRRDRVGTDGRSRTGRVTEWGLRLGGRNGGTEQWEVGGLRGDDGVGGRSSEGDGVGEVGTAWGRRRTEDCRTPRRREGRLREAATRVSGGVGGRSGG